MEFNFEGALKRLEEISQLMDKSETPLDKSMKLYSEAAELIEKCGKYLDEAKMKVELLEVTK